MQEYFFKFFWRDLKEGLLGVVDYGGLVGVGEEVEKGGEEGGVLDFELGDSFKDFDFDRGGGVLEVVLEELLELLGVCFGECFLCLGLEEEVGGVEVDGEDSFLEFWGEIFILL